MNNRGVHFPNLMNLIEAYEYKYKKQMFVMTLIAYVMEVMKVSSKTAKEYIEDMEKMGYIKVDVNGRVLRRVKV